MIGLCGGSRGDFFLADSTIRGRAIRLRTPTRRALADSFLNFFFAMALWWHQKPGYQCSISYSMLFQSFFPRSLHPQKHRQCPLDARAPPCSRSRKIAASSLTENPMESAPRITRTRSCASGGNNW